MLPAAHFDRVWEIWTRSTKLARNGKEVYASLFFSLFSLEFHFINFFTAALFALENREGTKEKGFMKCHPCFEKGKFCIFTFKISAFKGT